MDKLEKHIEDQIITDYKNMHSMSAVARKHKISASTVKRVLLRRRENPLYGKEYIEKIAAIDKQTMIKIIEDYNNLSPIEISKKYMIDVRIINKYLRKYKIKPKYNTNNWIKKLRENEKQVIQLYEKYQNLNRVVEELGMRGASGSLQQFLDEIGYEYKKNKPKVYNAIPIEDIEKIKKLHNDQLMTMNQIGKLYDVTAPTVAVFFDEHKIPRRSKAEATRVCNQDNELAQKRLRNNFQKKIYKLPSGKEISLMGYEPNFLDYVFENKLFSEEDINYSPNRIKYIQDNKKHYYFPDFYIKPLNLIVEIKSTYILNKQGRKNVEAKKTATIESGYNYVLILDNDFNSLSNFITR
jgi:transposase